MNKWIAVVFILCSCASGKVISPNNIEEITFGSGGGFTGQIRIYTLTSEGELFENDESIKNISSRHKRELFTKATELVDYSYNEPGNIYSFVQIKSNNKTNRIVWKYQAADLDQKVLSLYNSLMSITK